MVARKGMHNEITLPEAVVTRFEGVEAFDVSSDGACIILRPVEDQGGTGIRAKLKGLGLSEADVSDAVAWARQEH